MCKTRYFVEQGFRNRSQFLLYYQGTSRLVAPSIHIPIPQPNKKEISDSFTQINRNQINKMVSGKGKIPNCS
jgi:hypothetical protein